MGKHCRLPRIVLLVVLVAALPAAAQQTGRSFPVAQATAGEDVRLPVSAGLQKPPESFDAVWITNRSFRQIFEPYLLPQQPVFVTADAVLQAYHVLLANSLARFEQAAAPRLLTALRLMRQQVAVERQQTAGPDSGRAPGSEKELSEASGQQDPDYQGLRQRARQRARIVVAVALQLLGEADAGLDPEIAGIVETEVRRVEEARERLSPDWLRTADEAAGAVDYTDFAPRGGYLRSENLKRYFRAVRWLQAVAFRTDSDEELLAVLLLSRALLPSRDAESDDRRATENFLQCHQDLFGSRDDRGLLFAAGVWKDRPADLQAARQYVEATGPVAVEHNDPSFTDPRPSALYVIAPVVRPDEQFYRRRQRIEGFSYTEPSGLEMCALLGSDYARAELGSRLPEAYRRSLQAQIDRFGAEMQTDSLYGQYLHALAALLDPPEPDAPAFVREPAWQAKSCSTALSGWVQTRKLLPPQQRPPIDTFEDSFTEMPQGFVEPEPDFFDRLGELAERVPGVLDRCGGLPTPAAEFAASLRELERLLAEGRYPAAAGPAGALSAEERSAVETALTVLSALGDLRVDPAAADRHVGEIRAAAADVADTLDRGGYEQDPTYQALVIESGMDLKRRWQQLRSICRRLEVMAHKQLRAVGFNEKETYFLADFGTTLASVMLYSGDSHRRPRDDAPVAFTYFFDPLSNKHLHAAVGRPREIVVPYPFGGRQVQCRGAVMPYYQFIAATDFTDEQWRKRLDSDERPSAARWLDPVVLPGVPQKSWLQVEPPAAHRNPPAR